MHGINIDLDDVDIEDLTFEVSTQNVQDYISSPEFKSDLVKELVEATKEKKHIENKLRSIAIQLADTERIAKLESILAIAHGYVLRNEELVSDVKELLYNSFDDIEQREFLFKNFHTKFYRGTKILNTYKNDAVQKKLTREGYLSKVDLKSKDTPLRYLKYLNKAKNDMLRDQKMKHLEEEVDKLKIETNLVKIKYEELSSRVNGTEERTTSVETKLQTIEKRLNNENKFRVYKLKEENPHISSKEISIIIGVSIRTITSWLKEIRDLDL